MSGFDLDAAYELDPRVALRPERFGALLYHFGTRRLSFLKSSTLCRVVNSLGDSSSARLACAASGVEDAELATFARSLSTLAGSGMIRRRSQ